MLPLLPPSAAAVEVVASESRLLVPDGVRIEPVSAGGSFITWTSVAAGGNEDISIRMRNGDVFLLTNYERSDRQQAASGDWVAWVREMVEIPKGAVRVIRQTDIIAYDVDKKREVSSSSSLDVNESAPAVAGGRLAFLRTPQGPTSARVNVLDLGGAWSDARPLRPDGGEQRDPQVSKDWVVFKERDEDRWSLVAMRWDGSDVRTLGDRRASLLMGTLAVDGQRAAWVEVLDEASRVVWWDLDADQQLGSWDAPAGHRFGGVSIRGDLLVAEVIKGETRSLNAWCGSDGVPAPLPGYNPEAELPRLTPWGSVLFLSPTGTTVALFEKDLGCGALAKEARGLAAPGLVALGLAGLAAVGGFRAFRGRIR